MQLFSLVVILTLGLVGTSEPAEANTAGTNHVTVSGTHIDMKDICASRSVPITNIESVHEIINKLKKDERICPEIYRASIFELEPLLHLDSHQSICDDSKFNQIKEYHFKYINRPQEKYEFGQDMSNLEREVKHVPLTADPNHVQPAYNEYKQAYNIPQAIQQFFKSWALQVSGLCKFQLIENLENAELSYMTDDDNGIMENKMRELLLASSSKKQIDADTKKKLTRGTSFFELVYMPELEGSKVEGDASVKSSLKTFDLTGDPTTNKFMHACKKRFRPIYSKLILPIVKLAKLGYDYQGNHILPIYNKLSNDKIVKKWLIITAFCEAPGNYKLVDNAENPIVMKPLNDYKIRTKFNVDDEMWIKNKQALDHEFHLIDGSRSVGLKKAMYKFGLGGRKLLAAIDPHQSSFYREHFGDISNLLNILSISGSVASIAAG